MGPVGLSLFLFAVIAASILLDVGSIRVARRAVRESAFQKYSSALLFGAALLIAIMGFTRLDSTLGHMVLSSGVAVLLGLLLFIVFWLDHPFGRQLGLTPAPFAHALEVFDGVDRGR